MNWASWSEFFSMGGYAFYVWGSYAVATALIVMEIIALRNRRRAALAQASRTAPGARP
jgi:heme exporter protein D